MTEQPTLHITFKKIKKIVQIQKKNYGANLKIQFQPKSNFLSFLQNCLIYRKLCQFGFSSHRWFLKLGPCLLCSKEEDVLNMLPYENDMCIPFIEIW